MANKSLGAAKEAKNDEFYTRFDDVQKELNYYKNQFKDKVVYCNCDDPAESAFADFFKLNFDHFRLKKLICTRYSKSQLFLLSDPVKKSGYRLEITARNKTQKIDLMGDGDFRSPECIGILESADIVCTNPPFSLFRDYVAQLVKYNKKFLIIGPINAITYKEIFPFIKDNKMWSGYSKPKEFLDPDRKIKKLGNVQWWTNLDVKRRHEELPLYKKYSPEEYASCDNYNGINVDKTVEIPVDYYGVMSVPISFLDKHNPDQFEIIGYEKSHHLRTKVYPKQIQVDKNGNKSNVTKLNDGIAIKVATPPIGDTYYIVDGDYFVQAYKRLLIKRKNK
jgi:hypothetical protein